VQEIIAHVEFFRKSGKPTVAYVERGSENEYMLASACEEVYVPPLGLLLLFGHCVQGLYLRGTLDKLGMEPTVRALYFCEPVRSNTFQRTTLGLLLFPRWIVRLTLRTLCATEATVKCYALLTS
jgi:hypothetical protein